MRLLSGRCSGGNPSRSGGSYKASVLRSRPRTPGDRNTCSNAGQRWRDEQMAERTGVGRRIGVVMPDHSEGRPEQYHEQHYRDHYTPDSFLVRHYWGAIQDPRTWYGLV